MTDRDWLCVLVGTVGLVFTFAFCALDRNAIAVAVTAPSVVPGNGVASNGVAPAPPVEPPPSATVAATFAEGRATIAGFVPDEKTRERIIDAARRTWGASGVVDRLAVDARVAGLDWYHGDAVLAPFRVAGIPTGRAEFDGRTLVLSGQVASPSTRTDVMTAARRAAGKVPVEDRLVIAPAAVQKLKIDQVLASQRVEFSAGNANLTAVGRKTLDGLVPAMQEDRTTRLFVSGHTDNQGNPADNERLSEARAQSVVDYLVSRGVAKERLLARGFGSSQPIADNATDEGRRHNRRIEFQVRERGG